MVLNYRGTEITVTLDNSENGHAFEFMQNGIKTFIPISELSASFNLQTLNVKEVVQKLDDQGIEALPSAVKNIPYGQAKYNEIYAYTLENAFGTLGELLAKLCMNGGLTDYFQDSNLYCFNPSKDFAFFQPLIFDLESTVDSITATIVDGSGTIKYSIDNINWLDSNVFNGLEGGTEYTIYAKTLEDEFVSNYSILTKVTEIVE